MYNADKYSEVFMRAGCFFLFLICLFVIGCEKQEKKLRVGVVDTMLPIIFTQNENFSGFDVDLLKAIAEEIGYSGIEFSKMPDLQNAIEKTDIVISFQPETGNSSLVKKFSFDGAVDKKNYKTDVNKHANALVYANSKLTLLFNSEDPLFINQFSNNPSIDDLVFENIGVLSNSVADKYCGNKCQSFQKINDLLTALTAKKIDAALIENLQSEIITHNVNSFKAVSGPEYQHDYVFIFSKKFKKIRKFNESFDKLEADGKLEILKLRWFSNYSLYNDLLNQ